MGVTYLMKGDHRDNNLKLTCFPPIQFKQKQKIPDSLESDSNLIQI